MRLLCYNSNGGFELTDDLRHNVPNYAILSHTWLIDDQEIKFDDFKNGQPQQKEASYSKLEFCGKLAVKDGLRHFWMDTCCIDKSSSQELQEAITRMFEWYRNATKCYVYLTDVSVTEEQLKSPSERERWQKAFYSSRWFTRGWTLQELLAPASVEFYSKQGVRLGDKASLQQWVHEITSIPLVALRRNGLADFDTSERLSWAEHRHTTREEDKAYCLLGLCSIFMPLMYGEGETHAMKRLEAEIQKSSSGSDRIEGVLESLPIVPQAAFNSLENQYGSICLQDTRVELLGDISTWISGTDPKSIYWLNGTAGTGKSTVARTVARNITIKESIKQADRLFTTLAWQLGNRIPAVRPYICDAIAGHKDIALHSLRDQWDQLIVRPLTRLSESAKPSTVVLVIDALDECENDQDIRIILRLLATTPRQTSIRLRILITSRPEIPVRVGFLQIPETERQVFFLHSVPATLVDRDLRIFFEQSFKDLKEERGLSESWPGTQFIAQLVELSCGLFIWASTACRYIREGRRLALKRIQVLVQRHRSNAGPQKRLDEIYTTVLRGSIQEDFDDDEKEELYGSIKAILGSIVNFLSPLSTNALANLTDTDIVDVDETLADLHTILSIPDRKDQHITLHHPTFRDFLLDKDRCLDLNFWVNEKEAHRILADNCIDTMSRMLKANICGLPSPSTRTCDVPPETVEACIPSELQYACIYWAEHYRRSGIILCDGDKASQFLRTHYLHWIEAINLIGKSSEMSATIRMYESLLLVPKNPVQVPFVRDARKFIFAFQAILEDIPLQVYLSALAFIPDSNTLKSYYHPQLHPDLKSIWTAEADIPEAKEEWNYVNDIVFTSDGRNIASGSINEFVRVWNVDDQAPSRLYTGQMDKVSSIAISPDGSLIAAGSDDSTIMVWDTKTGATVHHLTGHSRWVNALQFSPDGKLLMSGSMDETILIHDVFSGATMRTMDAAQSCVNGLAFSPDGQRIASATVDKLVRLWNTTEYEVTTILDGHSGPINNVRFSPDSQNITSASDDTTLKIWSSSAGNLLQTLRGHKKRVWAIAYSPNGLQIASGSEDRTIMLWNSKTGSHLTTLSGHLSGINGVAFSPDGTILASGSFDDEVMLWDTGSQRYKGKLADFQHGIQSKSLGDLHVESLESNHYLSKHASRLSLSDREQYKGHTDAVTCIVLSSNGALVATGSRDTAIKLWSLGGTQLHHLSGHTAGIRQMKFSSTGHLLLSTADDKTLKVWNTATGTNASTLTFHTGDITALNFSLDETLLVSGSTDMKIVISEVATGAVQQILEGHLDSVNDVLFFPDMKTVVSCSSDTTIRLWNVDTGSVLSKFEGHTGGVTSISLSKDQRYLISGSTDGTILLWDLNKGQSCGIAVGHSLTVNAVAISADCTRILSCSNDATVRVWDFDTQALLQSLEVGTVVHTVEFGPSECIQTDRGMLVTCTSGIPPPQRPLSGPALFATDHWLKRNGEKMLWIPETCRPTSVAIRNNVAILGQSSGSIVFITCREAT